MKIIMISWNKYKPLDYKDWTRRGTPTLNAEQSHEDENITTLIACTGRLFTAATRNKQHGCEHKYEKQDQQAKAAFNKRNPHPTQ
jgi:hypothetical protein